MVKLLAERGNTRLSYERTAVACEGRERESAQQQSEDCNCVASGHLPPATSGAEFDC
jgi:hypothetical protein